MIFIIIILFVILGLGLGLGLGIGLGFKNNLEQSNLEQLQNNPEQLQSSGTSFMYKIQKMNQLDTSKTGTKAFTDGKYYRGCVVGDNKVIFAPLYSDRIGIYDMITGEFKLSQEDIKEKFPDLLYNNNEGYFHGAVAINETTAVLIPYDSRYICEYNIVDDRITKTKEINNEGNILTDNYISLFSDGVFINNKVIFVPYFSKKIIIYENKDYTTIDLPQSSYEYSGAVVLDNSVYFCPFGRHPLLKLDTSDNQIEEIDIFKNNITGFEIVDRGVAYTANSLNVPTINNQPEGEGTGATFDITGVRLEDRAITGLQLNNGGEDYRIGDILTIDQTTMANNATIRVTDVYGITDRDFPFADVAVIGNELIFAPYTSQNITTYNTENGNISTYPLKDNILGNTVSEFPWKYNGVTSLGNTAYFSPYNTNYFATFDMETKEITTFELEALDFEIDMTLWATSRYLYSGIISSKDTIVYIPFSVDTILAYSEQKDKNIWPIQREKTNGLVTFKGCENSFYFTGGNIDKIHEEIADISEYAFADCDGGSE